MFLGRLDTPAVSNVSVEGIEIPELRNIECQTSRELAEQSPLFIDPLALMGHYMWPRR